MAHSYVDSHYNIAFGKAQSEGSFLQNAPDVFILKVTIANLLNLTQGKHKFRITR
jgi:hypothetical protein